MFRLTVEQYHSMIQFGILTDDDRVELLEGLLIAKMPKSPPQCFARARLRKSLPGGSPRRWICIRRSGV